MLNQWWYATEHDPGLPIGAIIGLAAGYGVPADFEALANPDYTRLVKGSTVAGTNAGSNLVITTNSNEGNSNHTHNVGFIFTRGGSGGGNPASGNQYAAGGHRHSVSFYYNPKYAGLKLVRVTKDKIAVPEGGVLFSDTANLTDDDEGYTVLNDKSAALAIAASTGIIDAAQNLYVPDTNNSHRHHDYPFTGSMTSIGWSAFAKHGSAPYGGGNHGHGHQNLGFTPNLKYCILKAFKRIQESKAIGDRTIVLFDGTTVPERWSLCDGTNGTINVMDYFIKLATTGLGVKGGNNTISGSCDMLSGGGHNHYMTNTYNAYVTDYGHDTEHTHSHSASFGSIAWNPRHRTLKFIQFTG